MTEDFRSIDLLRLTAHIVGARGSHDQVQTAELVGLIQGVYGSLSRLGSDSTNVAPKQLPAVSIRASIGADHLVCLEDGRKQKALTRHLLIAHDMSPKAYRAKWGLPNDYPMVTAESSAKRRESALRSGLGQRSRSPASGKALPGNMGVAPTKVVPS